MRVRLYLSSKAAQSRFRVARAGVSVRLILCAVLGLVLSSCAGMGGASSEAGRGPVLIPPPPEEPRIQFLHAFSSELEVAPPVSAFRRFILGESEPRELGKPYGVAIHDGQVLVCDTRLGVVAVFDLVNRKLEFLGGDRDGRLGKPINIAIDDDGTRFVTDSDRRRLMIYDGSNRFLRSFGDPETWAPSGVAIVGDRIYVTDMENGQVVELEKQTGEEIRRFSQAGGGKEDLYFPSDLAFGGDGSMFVSDTGNFRVLKFDSEGKVLRQFGRLGKTLGRFVRPKGVAVDREGRLYVVDAAAQVVQIFDPDGNLLLFFGGGGNDPGELNLPAKVTIDYDNVGLFADATAPGFEVEYLILVTSQFGPNKVNVFGFLKPSE